MRRAPLDAAEATVRARRLLAQEPLPDASSAREARVEPLLPLPTIPAVLRLDGGAPMPLLRVVHAPTGAPPTERGQGGGARRRAAGGGASPVRT